MDSTLKITQEIDDIVIAQSKEYQIDDFSKQFHVHKSDFTIVSQNIRSIYSNLDDLLITLTQFRFSVDVITLNECRIDVNKPIPEIENYCMYSTSNHLNHCDGVVVYVKREHKVRVKEILLTHASCLQIIMPKTAVLAIYRSPSNSNAENFINSLNNHLYSLKSYKNIVITGDLNINIIYKPNESTNDRTNRLNYLNMLAMQGLMPGHYLPTRGENCLDHFILKLEKPKKSGSVAVLNTTITDHYMILLKLSNVVNTYKCFKSKTVVDFSKALVTLNESNISELYLIDDPVLLSTLIIEKLQNCLQQNTITSLIPRNSRIIKPWITLGVLRCIQNRNNMQKKLRLDAQNEILKITYRRYRNYCNNLIKKLRRQYDKQQLINANKNTKLIWHTINNITNRKPKKTPNLELLELKSTCHESVNHVNSYFSNIGKTLAEEISTSNHLEPHDENPENSHGTSFVLYETTDREVYETVMSLKSESSPGWDNIPTTFLKLAHEIIVPLVSHLTNLCFRKGIFPPVLKLAVITPVHKGGDKDDVNNYRPISVLPGISKIIEKLINSRLINFTNKYSIISPSQYGFRHKLSTEDAVLTLTNHIVNIVDAGKKCLTVFLDLKKAFDTVSVPMLVHSLEKIGVRGVALDLLSNYLQNRTQKVKVGNYISETANVSYGVPQGSVLGPTLFLIYINQLCQMKPENGRIISYADDTAVIFEGDSWESVSESAEKGLSQIAAWLNSHLLTLNRSKTKFITFTNYNSSQPNNLLALKIHTCGATNRNCSCQGIERVAHIKYLGVMVDQRLSWHDHTDMVMTRIRKLIWLFKMLRHVTTKRLLNMIYLSLAQSILVYCIPVWGGTIKTKFIELERAQRALIKVMYSKPYRFPTHELYSLSGLLTVRKLYILNTLLKFHKSLPYNPTTQEKRRKYLVAPVKYVKTTYAKRQYVKQSTALYNKINKLLNIYPLTSRDCKKSLVHWLKSKSYDEIELFLQAASI